MMTNSVMLSDLSDDARAAVLDALDPEARETIERVPANPAPKGAAAAVEQRARAAELVPIEDPRPSPQSVPVRGTRSNAEKLAADIASFMRGRKFTPKPPEPELTSPEIERFKQIVATAEANLAAAEARATELAERGGELELEELMGVKTAVARGAQNLKDQVSASHLIENRRRALAAARDRLAQAFEAAEEQRQQRRLAELRDKAARIVAASDRADKALSQLNEAFDRYLTEIADLGSYRDLPVHFPTPQILKSRERLAFAIAHAGDAVKYFLDSPAMPLSRRRSLGEMSRDGFRTLLREQH